jgi:4-amino-4-deoxy-L-arabinose transferase-like glycosyltransferase
MADLDTPSTNLASNASTSPNEEALPRERLRAHPRFGTWPAYAGAALVAILGVLLFMVLPPLNKGGIWDPHELSVADLGRRLAVNLHGAADLALADSDNTLPYLNDLGRPQLPFTSIALGMKLFGLHEWAGRLPLALWGVLGLLAAYWCIAQLIDRRAGVFSALVLACTPLYLVQARTMLGDIVTMSALSMACGGLLVAFMVPSRRLLGLLLGGLGVASGIYSRGIAVGAGVPLVTIGLTWAALAVSSRSLSKDWAHHGIGVVALLTGAALLVRVHFVASVLLPKSDLSLWIGAMIKPPSRVPTFDLMYAHLGHALAPWSALIPLAVGRMFITPTPAEGGEEAEQITRETATRMALLIGVSVCIGVQSWLAQRIDFVPFAAPFLVAAMVGIMLRDYERGAHPSIALAVVGILFLGLFHHDFHQFPEKVFQSYGVQASTFPEALKDSSYLIWTVVLVGMAGILLLVFGEDPRLKLAGGPVATRAPLTSKTYAETYRALRDAWDGNLAWLYLALVAVASVAGIVLWGGTRLRLGWALGVSERGRTIVQMAWWMIALAPPLVIGGAIYAFDLLLWAFGQSHALGKESALRGVTPWLGAARGLRGLVSAPSDAAKKNGEKPGVESETDESNAVGAAMNALFMLAAVPAVVLVALYRAKGAAWLALVSPSIQPYVLPLAMLLAFVLLIPVGLVAHCALGLFGDLMRGSRASLVIAVGVLLAIVQGVAFYPALANQLSPKDCFETYSTRRTEKDQLGLYGVGGKTAAYYAGGQPIIFQDSAAAFGWLGAPPSGTRRFLATRSEELALLNQLYRRRTEGRENLPVLDGRSSQILLLASSLKPGEVSDNPLSKIVLPTNSTPKIQHPLQGNWEDKIQFLGYDLADKEGRLMENALQARVHRFRFYFKVLTTIQSDWQVFIHLDGHQRRQNIDHKPTVGCTDCKEKYAMTRWNPGDVVVDDIEFTLDTKFSPADYTVYLGFFTGDTRMKVKSGPSDGDNRLIAGTMRVR